MRERLFPASQHSLSPSAHNNCPPPLPPLRALDGFLYHPGAAAAAAAAAAAGGSLRRDGGREGGRLPRLLPPPSHLQIVRRPTTKQLCVVAS